MIITIIAALILIGFTQLLPIIIEIIGKILGVLLDGICGVLVLFICIAAFLK